MSAPPATGAGLRRRNHGSGHSYTLDGEPVDGVTTILRNGVPKPALVQWAARETAGYAVDHWDELARLGLAERLRRMERAPNERRNQQAVRGTLVHSLAERLAAGETVDVPEHVKGHVEAYLRFAREWQVHDLIVEAAIANRRWRYAGTLDLVAQLADRDTWLLDFKTAASGVFSEAALQLAAYRNAEFYLDQDGAEQPLPAIQRCGCVWLRADGYDLIPVEADADTFRSFLYAMQVAHFAEAGRERYVGEALRASTRGAA